MRKTKNCFVCGAPITSYADHHCPALRTLIESAKQGLENQIEAAKNQPPQQQASGGKDRR